MEIKPIEGFDDYYVCNSGVNEQTVLSAKGTMKWLSPCTDAKGYKVVNLYKDGKSHTKKVHRLIAEAFIPNPEGKPCIDHINGVRDDNIVENIRWCTKQENNSFPLARERKSEAMKGKLAGEKHPMYGKPKAEGAGKQPKSVEQWSKDGTTLIARYESANEAARQTGIDQGSISKCCLGKCPTAGGYIWRYACI